MFSRSIKDSYDRFDFEAYLANFPAVFSLTWPTIALRDWPRRPRPRTRRNEWVVPMEAIFVIHKNANVREKPSTNSKKRGSAEKNVEIVATGHVPGRPWYPMSLPDGPAFIHTYLVKEIEPAELIAWYRVLKRMHR